MISEAELRTALLWLLDRLECNDPAAVREMLESL